MLCGFSQTKAPFVNEVSSFRAGENFWVIIRPQMLLFHLTAPLNKGNFALVIKELFLSVEASG